MMREIWQRHSETALRFGVVGVSNTLLSYVGFRLFFYVLEIAFIAQAIAYSIGILWSFWLNSHWTFRQSNYKHRQFARFLLLQLCLLLASAGAIGLMVDHAKLQPTLSWLFVMAIITVANYLLSRNWVFAERRGI